MAEHICPFFLPQRSSKLSTSTTTVQNECELKSAPICSPRRQFGAKLCEYVPLNQYKGWSMLVRPCAFFSMFLVTFFSPNLRGRAEKKQNVQRKKKALAQCSSPPDRQMTHLTHCVERGHYSSSSFSYFFSLIFFGERPFFAVKERSQSVQPINIANAFVLPSSLTGWEARTCFSFQIKHTAWFCQSKTSLLSAKSTFGDFNRRHSGFWFSVTMNQIA